MVDAFAKHRTARWIDIHINGAADQYTFCQIDLDIGRDAQLIIIRNVIINKYKTFISEQFLI